jgi:DNA-binding transcriptional LysR family regulator
MDVELARTFLEVVATKSFVRAADRLNVGQTTVSARIRLLEEQLGRPLFNRSKSGASLTPAGEQFLRYAPSFVQLWQRARQQVAVPPGHRAVLTVGGEVSLWSPLLLDWVIWMRQNLADIALHVQVDVPQDLINQVASGLIDAAIMYAPPYRPGLKVELLLEEELVLVASVAGDAGKESSARRDEYVHVDWGPDFALRHGVAFPDITPGFFANLGPLALSYVLAVGGSGYFRMHTVQPYIDEGRLRAVAGAPRFSYPIYAVYSASTDEELLRPALAGLRACAVRGPHSASYGSHNRSPPGAPA